MPFETVVSLINETLTFFALEDCQGQRSELQK